MSEDQHRAQLQSEIAALQQAIALLAAQPGIRHKLEADLAAKQQALAALQGASSPAPGHGQTIGGNARVGIAIAGDVHGSVINTGTLHGNAIGANYGSAQSDTVYGDQTVNQGPQIYGPIHAQGNVNIATEQTINNAAPPGPPASPAPLATTPPELRLWLEGQDGAPLSALTLDSEAALRVGPAPGAALPDLVLQLEASGAGVEWPDGSRRTFALSGGALARAVRWALIPSRPGPLTLRVLALANDTLVQQLALAVECHPAGAVLSGGAAGTAAPPPTAAVGLQLSSVPSLPAHANALTLVLDREREGMALRLIDGGSASACQLALTDAGLGELLAYARTELLAIVGLIHAGRLVFQQFDLAIPAPIAEQSLARLARLGAYLWQALFAGTGGGRDAEALGERLRARSQAGALHLVIAAAHLPFPWPLLYDRDPSAPITPDGFWGFRHVLTSLPTSGRSGPMAGNLSLGPAERLRALVGLNLTIDQHPQLAAHPVIPSQRQLFGELGLISDEVTDEIALRGRLAEGSDAGLVYLFCHMLSALPGTQPARAGATAPGAGSTRIVLTDGKQALALRDLEQAAPLSRAPLLRGGPLVVLNACGSAELSPLTYNAMVPYLLDQGARAVIGTECDTPIYFGAAFGAALLRAVVRERLSVGAALRAARRAFFEQQQNPLGLLYALYGSADLRVQDAQA